jgi:NodT family efflux transporter outer membrane factor (OMF) lipoprotein
MNPLTVILKILPVTLLMACAAAPPMRRADIGLPPTFRNGQEIAAVPEGSADTRWWTGFRDPLLTRIIDRALAGNTDVAAAAARIDIARAAVARAGGALAPQISLGAAAASAHDSRLSPFGEAARAAGLPRDYQTYSLGPQASWELDLFGGLRYARRAAVAEAQATVISNAAVRLAIAAEAAEAYLDLRGMQAELQLLEAQENTQSRLLELVRLRVQQGVSADRDQERALADLERVRASKPAVRSRVDAQIYRLDVLMGAPAGTDYGELEEPQPQPLAPPPAGDASPAGLMRRRPDIVVAERHLAAATARIGAARAEYYPHLNFNGLAGFESVDAGRLFETPAQQGAALLGLRWRLFDFGRVDAELAIARGAEAEALAAYRSTVLQATADVETALSRFAQSRSAAAVLSRQIAALTLARDEAQTAFEGGVVPLIEVLDADRDLLAARTLLVTVIAEQARAAVASFRSLGGGWTAAQAIGSTVSVPPGNEPGRPM